MRAATFADWDQFRCSLQARYGSGPVRLESEYGAFREFVDGLPKDALIPLLLRAYDRYRELSELTSQDDFLERDCYSILISTILQRNPRATEAQALAILRSAFHQCGHGDDVAPPLEIVLSVFKDKPYSRDLFDAMGCYREALRHVRASTAFNTKRRIELVLWHDPKRILPKCHSRRIQLSLLEMPDNERWPWQRLLRHYSLAMGPSPGKAWFNEARRLLCAIDANDFVARLENWFAFPAGEQVELTGTGSNILRTLLWAGTVVHDQRIPFIQRRVKSVHWKDKGSADKLIAALRWIESGPEPRQSRGLQQLSQPRNLPLFFSPARTA